MYIINFATVLIGTKSTKSTVTVSSKIPLSQTFLQFSKFPLVEDKKPPVVDGVGDENLDPIADQMARKLINGVGEEEGQHRKVKRTLMSDATGKNHYVHYLI